ncbi:MAG: DUF928 domain-containing protein [Phormidesmis sp.]
MTIRLKKMLVQAGLGAGLLLTSTIMPAVANQNTASSLRQGLPGRRISGGSRSDCMAGSPPVVALNPETNLGETMSDRPSIYFIIPELEDAYPLEFSLRDSAGNSIYEKSLTTRDSEGVVSIQLPPQSLQVQQDYRWYFSVVCDAHDPFQNDVLSGWLRQVEPNTIIESSIEASINTSDNHSVEKGHGVESENIENALALARSYQTVGLWNDAISALASLREQYPNNDSVNYTWSQLLQALRIDAAVSTPIATR